MNSEKPNKKTQTINVDFHVPKEFKQGVFISLKQYGLLCPTSYVEVELFMKDCGNTRIELPDELKNSEDILRWAESKIGSENIIESLAARNGESLSDETVSKMKKIHKEFADGKSNKPLQKRKGNN